MHKPPRTILIVFCSLLLMPFLGQLFGLDPFPRHNENRTLAKRPDLAWSLPVLQKFPREYQAYFSDNFGLRNLLVRGNYLLRYHIFGVSPSPMVIVGNKGWLYYTGAGEIEDCRGITHFNEKQLKRWADILMLKKGFLEQKGVRYLLVIPPNKSSIYPEYLPPRYPRVRSGSGLDDFLSYMRSHTDLDIVDMRAPFIAEKARHELYLRTDTHWNTYGAFLGYRELVRPLAAWFPTITPFTLEDFFITFKDRPAGDLAGMMGATEFLSDRDYLFAPKVPFSATIHEKSQQPRGPFTMRNERPGLPRAVIFRDSFFIAMVPFIAEHFRTSRFIWSRWNAETQIKDILSQYQPDVVIEEVVERLVKNDPDMFAGGMPPYLSEVKAAKAQR